MSQRIDTLNCPRISFPRGSRIDAATNAFRDAPVLVFGQAWRDSPESAFSPGEVRIGWTDDRLLILAVLHDEDVFSNATRDNERLWELGDVFEIFAAEVDAESYLELHVAPNGLRLQLRFPNSLAVREVGAGKISLDRFKETESLFDCSVSVEPDRQCWRVLAEVSAASVTQRNGSLHGGEWLLSFGRYDYTRGLPAPVLSSTSPHSVPSFHRREEWTRVRFHSPRRD